MHLCLCFWLRLSHVGSGGVDVRGTTKKKKSVTEVVVTVLCIYVIAAARFKTAHFWLKARRDHGSYTIMHRNYRITLWGCRTWRRHLILTTLSPSLGTMTWLRLFVTSIRSQTTIGSWLHCILHFFFSHPPLLYIDFVTFFLRNSVRLFDYSQRCYGLFVIRKHSRR